MADKLPAILQEQADVFGVTLARTKPFAVQKVMSESATPGAKTIAQLQIEIRAKDELLKTAKLELDTAWGEVQRLQQELHRVKTKKQNLYAARRRIVNKTK